MEKIEHPVMVARLAKPGDEILASLTPEKAHLAHMSAGISGEAGELLDAILKANSEGQELDRKNVVEELGDLEFYMEGLRAPLGLSRDLSWEIAEEEYPALSEGYTTYYAGKIAVCGSEVLDAVKKHCVYLTALDLERVYSALQHMDKFMEALRDSLEISREECLEANIEKLRLRYEDLVYSDKQAQERADKAEG